MPTQAQIDALDHDGDGRMGGSLPMSKRIEAMTDPDLRDFIKDRTGRKPHPQSSRDVLLAKARAALPHQQPDETPMSEAPTVTVAEEVVGDLGKFDRVEDVPANPDAEANIAAAKAKSEANRDVAMAAAKAEAKAKAQKPEATLEPTRLEKVGMTAELMAAQRVQKLKDARAKAEGKPVDTDPPVQARVLKKGDGKISTGTHAAGLGDLCYDHKEVITLPRSTALIYEERGYVEIED